MEPSTTAGTNNAKDGEELIVPDTTTTTITLTYLLDQKWFAPMLVDRLCARDALRFAAVSRNCRVVRLQAPLDFDDTTTTTGAGAAPRTLDELGRRDAYHAKVWHTLPRIPHNTFHTVLLQCSWRDQGWGNSKGMLSVATNDGRAPDDYKPWSDRIVCGKEPAPHKLTPLCLQFRPYTRHTDDDDDTAKFDKHDSTTATTTVTGSNEDDNGHTADNEDNIQPYTIWYRIGGGGGHRLIVKDLCVRILTYAQHHEQEHDEHEQQGLL